MKLGIVGHAADKFTPETEALALKAIRQACTRENVNLIISGHSPLRGVDIWAEQIAADLRILTLIHAPKVNQWDGPGGFKERNLAIARDSDLVLCVVVEKLPENYHGMKFDYCYHCKGRNPPHIKSGGCWTAWKAKAQEWFIIK